MNAKHEPVMLKEVLDYLSPGPGQNFIDCTFGSGGHAAAILNKIGPNGQLLGIDASADVEPSIRNYESEIRARLVFANDNFANLQKIYERDFPYPVNGILFDLGLSSIELDQSGRGFSFLRDEPLDMRFNADKQRTTAAEVLNRYGELALIRIFREFGEVDRGLAQAVARAIIKERRRQRFEKTFDLVRVILICLYGRDWASGRITLATTAFYRNGKKIIHPATRFFQALRLEVNRELDNLKEVLPAALEILSPEGRLAVISFHSLEDRLVKNYFRDWSKAGLVKLLTKKPLRPSTDEIDQNRRSRSAKMRVIEKISHQ